MTISSQTRKAGPFVGSGSTGPFAFAFKIFQPSDMLVVKVNNTTSVETTLVLTTDFTVSLNFDQNSNPGGNVTLVAPLAVGYNMVMSSQIPYLQETDLTNQGGFYPEVITSSLDNLTIQTQQLKEEVDRSAKLPITSAQSADDLVADIVRIAASAANIDIVANNIASVNTDAAAIVNINTVAGSIANVNSVGSNITNVNTNATNIANINTNATNIVAIQNASANAATATAQAGIATTQASNASASAASAAAIAGAFVGTSTSSLLIAIGSKSFTTQTAEQYTAGVFLSAVSAANTANFMFGQVTSYNSGTGALVLDVQVIGGSGTYGDWNISLVGARGATGTGITAQAVGWTGTGGTTPKTLTVDDDLTTAQAARRNAANTFTGLQTLNAGQRFTGSTSGTINISAPAVAGSGTLTLPVATETLGYLNIPFNSQSAAYTTVLADSGKTIFHPSTDANARTFTIDSNANVPYATGTAITFINMTSQVVTIAITTDTMYLSSAGTTGSRSLAQYGSATAIKMTSTTWLISGSGLT